MKLELKDALATTFGYTIAYLLPGLLGLYALSFWYLPFHTVADRIVTGQSSLSLLLLVLLSSVLMSVELVAFRWVLFDCLLCRKDRLGDDDFAKLAGDNVLAAFQVAVDQHYRYHQFWGALVFVIPALVWGLAHHADPSTAGWAGFIGGGVVLEAVTLSAAMDAFKKYILRAHSILTGV